MLGYLKKMTKIDTCRGSESPKNSGHTPLPECSQYSTEASTSYSIPVVENKSKTTIIMNTDDNEAKLFPEGDDDSTYQQEQHGCHLLPASLLKRTTKMDPESGSHKLSPVSRRTPQSNVEPDCEPFQLEILSSKTTSPTTFCPTIASALWRPLWPPGEELLPSYTHTHSVCIMLQDYCAHVTQTRAHGCFRGFPQPLAISRAFENRISLSICLSLSPFWKRVNWRESETELYRHQPRCIDCGRVSS